MFQFSVFDAGQKTVDAHADHLLVLNHLIQRRDNAYTPYLFSAFQHGDKRWYCIQADRMDINPDFHKKLEPIPLLSRFSNKENSFCFYIRLNPAIKRTLVDPKRGKYDRLIPIKEYADALNWLKSNLMENGVAVSESEVKYQQPTPCSRGNTVIHDMLFWVRGYIFDLEKFESLQLSGFGKRKGYGFGMLIPQDTFGYSVLQQIY